MPDFHSPLLPSPSFPSNGGGRVKCVVDVELEGEEIGAVSLTLQVYFRRSAFPGFSRLREIRWEMDFFKVELETGSEK